MVVVVCVLQYWYEGDQAGDLPVDFSIVWDGDFFIDKPSSMKGNIVRQEQSSRHGFFSAVHAADVSAPGQ